MFWVSVIFIFHLVLSIPNQTLIWVFGNRYYFQLTWEDLKLWFYNSSRPHAQLFSAEELALLPHTCLGPFLGFIPHLPHNPGVIHSAAPDLFPLLLMFSTHFWRDQKDREAMSPSPSPSLCTAGRAGEASPQGGSEWRERESSSAPYRPLFSACKSSARLLNWTVRSACQTALNTLRGSKPGLKVNLRSCLPPSQ